MKSSEEQSSRHFQQFPFLHGLSLFSKTVTKDVNCEQTADDKIQFIRK
jgi:hypothetical protein